MHIGEEDEIYFRNLFDDMTIENMEKKRIPIRFKEKTPEEQAELYQKWDEQALEYDAKKQTKNKTTKKEISELQTRLVKCCIDFINEKNLGDIEKIDFTADSLQYSAEEGGWTPATDSSIVAYEEELCEGTDYHYLSLKPFIDYC